MLQDNLGIDNIRHLENLIIDCIYENVIKAKLDQQGKQIIVEFAIGRDLQDGDLENMIDTLTQWQANSETLLETIQQQKTFIRAEHDAIQAMKDQSARINQQTADTSQQAPNQ